VARTIASGIGYRRNCGIFYFLGQRGIDANGSACNQEKSEDEDDTFSKHCYSFQTFSSGMKPGLFFISGERIPESYGDLMEKIWNSQAIQKLSMPRCWKPPELKSPLGAGQACPLDKTLPKARLPNLSRLINRPYFLFVEFWKDLWEPRCTRDKNRRPSADAALPP
jgi:hypothetical protein